MSEELEPCRAALHRRGIQHRARLRPLQRERRHLVVRSLIATSMPTAFMCSQRSVGSGEVSEAPLAERVTVPSSSSLAFVVAPAGVVHLPIASFAMLRGVSGRADAPRRAPRSGTS